MLGDGRFLIALTGIALALSGGFAVLQSLSGELLPHDSHAIGLTAAALVRAGNHHLLGFMFHDRVAYGGTLLAIGAAYWWLSEFPMAAGEGWAWWALLVSGGIGFSAFLTYLGQGYLDTWHGVATLFLLPVLLLVFGVTVQRLTRRDPSGPGHYRRRMVSRAGAESCLVLAPSV